MSDPTIHPDWDAEKAAAHIADLERQRDEAHAVHDAFMDGANEAWRTVLQRRSQIDHSRKMFSQPREPKS